MPSYETASGVGVAKPSVAGASGTMLPGSLGTAIDNPSISTQTNPEFLQLGTGILGTAIDNPDISTQSTLGELIAMHDRRQGGGRVMGMMSKRKTMPVNALAAPPKRLPRGMRRY